MQEKDVVISRADASLFTVREATGFERLKAGEVKVTLPATDLENAVKITQSFARLQRHLALDAGREYRPYATDFPFAIPSTEERDYFARENGRNTLLDGAARAIRAVGNTPEEAIEAWCDSQADPLDKIRGEIEKRDPDLEWGFSIETKSGAYFKVAGWNVPGGVVLTWVK